MKKIDFNRTAVDDPSIQWDLSTTLDHLAWTVELMRWFNCPGKELLEAKQANSRLVWEGLYQKAFDLYRDFSESRSVKELFVRVVERGIDDVTALAKDMAGVGQKEEPSIRNWAIHIANYCLSVGLKAGLGGDACSEEKTQELLTKLAAVAQITQSSQLLAMVVERMAPHNELTQKLLAEHYMNW